jgi:hypothetical protein
MATTYKLISSVTVGSGGAANIDFTSIPSTYTDLCIKLSSRCAAGTTNETGTLRFNSDSGSNYSARRLQGTGSVAQSASFTSTTSIYSFYPNLTSSTSDTFSNAEIYIPNYAGSTQKSISSDSVSENNATAADAFLTAGLWTGTVAITSISMGLFSGSFAQYSTAYLYGISNA